MNATIITPVLTAAVETAASGATRVRLADGRWHLQHGPIDIIAGADGDAHAVSAAHDACWQRFAGVLAELVGELPLLRRPLCADATALDNPCSGPIARRMWAACHPHRAHYITPMAAVAGSVADELIAAFARPGVARAFVNNGGDIALHLTDGQHYRVGVFADLAAFDGNTTHALDAHLTLDASMPVRGIATSGWRGRSFSLGIADSATVLARTAADADAAATIVANAVDLDHAGIVRRPASSLNDDSDLGELPVTVDVPLLPPPLIDFALERGARVAQRLCDDGTIAGAALFLQRRARATGIAAPTALDKFQVRPDDTRPARTPDPMEASCSKYAAC
ncbi:UPF0280 family protein [Paraburkholderia sp.]|uniref:UPF0280 family protein n=1 Tax=Paraburkholderia sp. TaxID=1926495 RepID=UPI003D6E06B4